MEQDLPYSPSADDERGYTILPAGDLTPPELTYYRHDIELAQEALSLTSRLSNRMHSLFDISATSPENAPGTISETEFALKNVELELASSNYRSWMTHLATDLSVIPPFNQRLFLDYESMVREVTIAGNSAGTSVATECKCGRLRMQTRSRKRVKILKDGFCRHLDLKPDRNYWLVRTAFGG